ncbi:MAG: FtsX-like permease family protein [Actinobacteria bacterium]|nr:FtsX-like permease family protein [Actinomycetota bacterium]
MPGISIARNNLFQDRRRAILSILGVSAAFILILILDGIFAGAMRQVSAYIRSSSAEVFVAQRDVRTMHMTVSVLAPTLVDKVRAIDGVAWVDGLRYTTSTIDSGDTNLLTYVFGYDTATGRGGPARLSAGRAPTHGEAIVDSVAADELGVGLGQSVTILGQPFIISGLSMGGTYIANTTVFITSADFATLRGPSYAYILVGARADTSAEAMKRNIEDALPEVTVMTRSQFADQEENVVRSMAADVMAMMSAIGYLIALALIGLTLFTATVAKQREFGIIKALGAGRGRLTKIVLAQAAWTVGLALALATLLSIALGAAIEALTPNFAVDIQLGSVLRTAISAFVVAMIAAFLPLRRVTRVDPATAFRMR